MPRLLYCKGSWSRIFVAFVFPVFYKCKHLAFIIVVCVVCLYRLRQITFCFGNCFKKELLKIFSNFFFYLKVQSFRLIRESNFHSNGCLGWPCRLVQFLSTLSIVCRKMAHLCLWTKIRTKQCRIFGTSAFQCMRAGFLCPNCHNFACLYIRQDQNEFYLKRWFFCCQNRHLL